MPASYSDIAPDLTVRDHVGDAWYQTTVRVPRGREGERIVLRFGSATHRAVVWVDTIQVAGHDGGYTPFEADVTDHVRPGGTARITGVVKNELTWTSIPPNSPPPHERKNTEGAAPGFLVPDPRRHRSRGTRRVSPRRADGAPDLPDTVTPLNPDHFRVSATTDKPGDFRWRIGVHWICNRRSGVVVTDPDEQPFRAVRAETWSFSWRGQRASAAAQRLLSPDASRR